MYVYLSFIEQSKPLIMNHRHACHKW